MDPTEAAPDPRTPAARYPNREQALRKVMKAIDDADRRVWWKRPPSGPGYYVLNEKRLRAMAEAAVEALGSSAAFLDRDGGILIEQAP